MKEESPSRIKTYKREVAFGLLSLWVAIAIKLFVLADPASVGVYNDLFVGVTWPIMGIVGSMFGLDHWTKAKK